MRFDLITPWQVPVVVAQVLLGRLGVDVPLVDVGGERTTVDVTLELPDHH